MNLRVVAKDDKWVVQDEHTTHVLSDPFKTEKEANEALRKRRDLYVKQLLRLSGVKAAP